MDRYELLLAATPEASGKGFDWQGLLELVPELEPLSRTPQDPLWHAEGDVLTHTRMVCEAMCGLPDYQRAAEQRRFVLFWAALLHDIAKPACTSIDGERIVSPGHSRRGAVDARIMLWRAGVPFEAREQICRIIANHQIPFFAVNGKNRAGESPEFVVRRLSWELSCIADLAAVAEADIRGRICADQQRTLDNIELFREMARDEHCLESPRNFADRHTRIMHCRSAGAIPIDYPFFQEPGSKVIVLSGLPASGKDTYAHKDCKGLPVVSYDDAREELGIRHGDNMGAAVQLALERARECLRKKAPFVWNATHLSREMRQKTLELLFAYHAEVSIVYLEHSEEEILRRNAKRNTTLTNEGIARLLHRWEVPLITEAHEVTYLASGGA